MNNVCFHDEWPIEFRVDKNNPENSGAYCYKCGARLGPYRPRHLKNPLFRDVAGNFDGVKIKEKNNSGGKQKMNMNESEIKRAIRNQLEIYGDTKKAHLMSIINGGLPWTQSISDTKLRHLIRQMVVEDGDPIGSTTERGYYICRSQEDFDEATKNLKSRLIALNIRIYALKKNTEHITQGKIQLGLFNQMLDNEGEKNIKYHHEVAD